MSISFSSISVPSTILNLRSSSLAAIPHDRFFQMRYAARNHLLRLCSANCTNYSRLDSSDFDSSSAEREGSDGKEEKDQAVSPNEYFYLSCKV